MAQPTKSEWQDYQHALQQFIDGDLQDYIDNYNDEGQNPKAPLPPTPPSGS
jgi:hypothetical protein